MYFWDLCQNTQTQFTVQTTWRCTSGICQNTQTQFTVQTTWRCTSGISVRTHRHTVHSANNMDMYFWNLCQNTQTQFTVQTTWIYVLLDSVRTHRHSSQCKHGDVLLGSLSEHTNTVHNANNMEMYFWNLCQNIQTQFTVQTTWRCTSGICVRTQTPFTVQTTWRCISGICDRTHRHSSQCKKHGDVLLESVSEHIDRVHDVNHEGGVTLD